MKPAPFDYMVADSLADALAALHDYGYDAKPLAGGQSLVPLLNMRLARPRLLVDLNRLAALAFITERDGGIAIGAMTRQRAVEQSALIAARCPLLAQAIRYVGHFPIRTRGTVGGSVAHADPAAEIPGVLVALEGHVRLRSQRGERVVPSEAFFVDTLTTVAEPDELVTEIWLPALPERTSHVWLEVARRHGDYALVGLGAVLTLDDAGAVHDVRLAFIGVGGRPVRARQAEERLRGERLSRQLLAEAARLVASELDPADDLHASRDYRRHVAGVLAQRALADAYRRVTGEELQ